MRTRDVHSESAADDVQYERMRSYAIDPPYPHLTVRGGASRGVVKGQVLRFAAG